MRRKDIIRSDMDAEGLREHLSEADYRHVELFRRFLSGERSHEVVAWALHEPMSSANDPIMVGMGL